MKLLETLIINTQLIVTFSIISLLNIQYQIVIIISYKFHFRYIKKRVSSVFTINILLMRAFEYGPLGLKISPSNYLYLY